LSASQNDKLSRLIAAFADAALFVWLFTEVAFEHSALSQAGMLLFVLAVIAYAIRSRRVFFSWWMACYALLILWGALVSFHWAADRAESLSMVKTLAINAVFFFFLFQYLLLRADPHRFLAAFVLAAAALSAYAFACEWPFNWNGMRLGIAAGINPNWIGMLAAAALGMCLVLAKQKSAFWLMSAVLLLPAAVLSKSAKALALAALLIVAITLVLYPKRWWLKLLLFLTAGAAAFYFVIFRENALSNGLLHRLHVMAHYLVNGSANADSLIERGSLMNAAWEWFLKRPLTGWGIGCFHLLEGAQDTYSHCNYTELLVSGGLPFALLYYGTEAAALVCAARAVRRSKKADPNGARANERALTGALIVLLAAQIVMDAGMVSYYDRTAAVYLVLPIAAARLLNASPDDGTRLVRFLKNPRRLFVYLTEHGWFRRMDDEIYLRRLYRALLGKKLRLDPPVTMNEKIQWLKLHDRNPLYPTLVDKIAVRGYVKERAGEAYLIPLLGVWNDPDAIDGFALPERFVLKCSHNSGGVIVCADKSKFDFAAARRALKGQLARNYCDAGREWPYRNVPRRVLAEAFIGAGDGTPPDDIKFFCFGGAMRAVVVCTNRRGKHADYYFFDRDFQPLPVNEATANRPAGFRMERPAHYDEMITLAERLSAGLPFVRVDLYDTADGVRFGELTLYDQSGFADDYVGDGDRVMGEFLRLEGIE